MKALFKSVDCLSLKVNDLPKALAFYSEKLGHNLKWKTATSAGLELPDGQTELVLHTEQIPTETCLLVESVPEAIKRFTSAGGKLLAGPFDLPVGLYAQVLDLFGNKLALIDLSKGVYQVDKERNVIGVGA